MRETKRGRERHREREEVGVGDRNGLTDRQTDRRTDRQIDRQTGRQTDRQTDRPRGGRERGGGGSKNTCMLIHVYKQQEVRGRATVTR